MFSITRPIRGGFRFSQDNVEKLVTIVATFVGSQPDIRLSFRNGREITTADVKEIFEDGFIRSSFVKQIAISGESRTSRATLILIEHEGPPIIIDLRGTRQETLITEMNVQNEVRACRQWYSYLKISQVPSVNTTSAFYILSVSVWVVVLVFYYTNLASMNLFKLTPWLAVLCLLPPALDYAFPSIIFDFGFSARKGKVRRGFLAFLVTTLIFGVVIGVAGNLATDAFKAVFSFVPSK